MEIVANRGAATPDVEPSANRAANRWTEIRQSLDV